MAKKTFVLKSRLVKGDRWHIDYQRFDPGTGETTRHRQDFSLNEIEDIAIREHVAGILCRHLEHFARLDAPIKEPKGEGSGQTVREAVEFAWKLKINTTTRTNSHKSYNSILRHFLEWAQKRSYANVLIVDFSRKHAQAFFDYLVARRKYKGRTLNNYLLLLRTIWYELENREIVPKNVWAKIKSVREEEKTRRAFNEEERRIVAGYIREHDYWLFRALLLQYYCYIRPVEISRLRFKSFDLGKGLVKVEAFESKKWKQRWATIPGAIMPYFIDGTFDKQPANYYILGFKYGDKAAPAPLPGHPNRAYKRHRKILEGLLERGELKGITGLTWYSWKDTGISAHAKQTTPLATRDQAGHTDFQMTLTYYQSEKVNEEYRILKDDLF